MGGDATARHNLGCAEGAKGDYNKALKHLLISVGSGLHDSLDTIKTMYRSGQDTKEDYAKALRAYQTYLDDIKAFHVDERRLQILLSKGVLCRNKSPFCRT